MGNIQYTSEEGSRIHQSKVKVMRRILIQINHTMITMLYLRNSEHIRKAQEL